MARIACVMKLYTIHLIDLTEETACNYTSAHLWMETILRYNHKYDIENCVITLMGVRLALTK